MADSLPAFLKKDGDSLLFALDEGEFVFYVPEVFFDSSKIASVLGNKVQMFGLCNYAIFNKNGKAKAIYPFTFPTIFLTEPYRIDKVKGLNISKALQEAYSEDDDFDANLDINPDQQADPDMIVDDDDSRDYRLLRYKKGDKIVVNTRVPQSLDNVEYFFNLIFLTAKFPTTIPYDKLHELFIENGDLNNFSYGLNMQNIGISVTEICRSKKDPSKPFRLSHSNNMHDYTPMSIKLTPKFVSPYSSITSENFDQSLMGAILTDSKTPTPLEKVVMM